MRLTWPRICMLMIFLNSWLFLFSSGLLVFAIRLETGKEACEAGIIMCTTFYVTSKIFIYFFLVEKVHIVWQPHPGTNRFSSRIFVVCFFTVCLYIAVIAIMALAIIHNIRPDGRCMIGIKTYSAILLLFYDLFVNILFTALFVWPILRFNLSNSFVRGVAMRTLVAAIVALTTSSINITLLTFLDGAEWGWICLGSCGVDVIINALALFYATTSGNVSNELISFHVPEMQITLSRATLPVVPNSLTVPTAAYTISLSRTLSTHGAGLPLNQLLLAKLGSTEFKQATLIN